MKIKILDKDKKMLPESIIKEYISTQIRFDNYENIP